MPVLLVELHGYTRGVRLPPRLLIGRRSMNHLVIDDATISRMHAWIDQCGSDFVLTDMQSRTGTRVNGQPLGKCRNLAGGDVIEIGPAKLTFLAGETLPQGVEPLALPSEPATLARDVGIRFDCPHCGAPMWASTQYAGHGGICTYCGGGFTIPRMIVGEPPSDVQSASTGVAAPEAAGMEPRAASSVAPPLEPGLEDVAPLPLPVEAQPSEPASSVTSALEQPAAFASEADTSTAVATAEPATIDDPVETPPTTNDHPVPGSPQVNVLAPPLDPAAETALMDDATIHGPAPRTPSEHLLLGLSAMAAIASGLTFGVVSLAMLIWLVAYLQKSKANPDRKTGPLIGSIALSVFGLVAGPLVSYFLFR